jgi:regulator of sigma E protease
VAFILLLTVLVLIHEIGHFLVARKAGVVVEEFGFGLPPRAKTLFMKGGTRFSLNWIPFGGFVRLQGENAPEEQAKMHVGSFGRASVPWRIAILIAGVAMNFLFALILFTIGFSVGRWIPTYVTFEEMQRAAASGEIHMQPAVLIDEVLPGGEAQRVALPVPSILVKVNGTPVTDPMVVSQMQKSLASVTYEILTGPDFKTEKTVDLSVREGKTGISLRSFPRDVSAPVRSVPAAFLLGLREAKVMTEQTIIGMGALFHSLVWQQRVPEGITGIVGIAQLTDASIHEGFMTYLRLVALLSLSLAILNILPFPALDGGRLLFVLIEVIRRKPANRKFEVTTNMIGFAILILLILIVTYHDILRLFHPLP